MLHKLICSDCSYQVWCGLKTTIELLFQFERKRTCIWFIAGEKNFIYFKNNSPHFKTWKEMIDVRQRTVQLTHFVDNQK